MPDSPEEIFKRIQAFPEPSAPAAGKAAEPSAQDVWQKIKDFPDKAAEPKADESGVWGALKAGLRGGAQGMMETGQGITQLLSRAIPGQAGARAQGDINQQIQQGQQAYQASPAVQQRPLMAGAGRIGGNIAATTPLAAIPGMGAMGIAGRAALGAGMGAAGAATQPVTGGDYWTEKAKQIGAGAATGGVMGVAGAAMGPPMSQMAQTAITKFPHIASLVRGTALRSPDNFNRAAVNQALDPIKTVIPANVKAGHDLINEGISALSDEYNRVLPPLTMKQTPALDTELANIKSYTGQMSADKHAQLVSYIENHVEKPLLAKGGVLDGDAIKKIQSQIGSKAHAYSISKDADQQALGEELYGVRETLMDEVANQNPAQATALKNVNQAYAQFSRVRDASSRDVESLGIFTPRDLLMAARGGNKGAFQKGDAAMQAVGEAALGPMSAPKVNRILTEILGGSAGFALHGPMGALGGTAAGMAGPEIARGVMRATQTPVARGVGQALSRGAAGGGDAAARFLSKRPDTLTQAPEKKEPERDPYVSPAGL